MKQYKIRMLISCCLLIAVLCACSFFQENMIGGIRGDWDVNLYGEYDLVRVNSHCIEISKKAGEGGWRTMIPRFFVTGFSIREPYILLEGIQTADGFMTDQEKEARILSYYALNTTDDSVIGPFDTADELMKELDLSGIDWTPVTDPPDLPNVNY